MRNSKHPIFRNDNNNGKGWFAIIPVIPPIFISAALFYAYYYIRDQNFLPLWMNYIYWGVKIIIALQIVLASARSLWGPIIAVALGFLNLYWIQTTGLAPISSEDAWQLITLGGFGFLITIIMKVFVRT
ncbi:MAG: hypothetical protein ACD_60C00119G0025 [uncultured bacterium]|nr:MAG: hypothetical protein ACD_60C00119G0025 [uncultured bacterium]